MSVYEKLRGFVGNIFQFGFDGVQAKPQGASAMDLVNSTDSGFANLRVATPLVDNDAVTKLYADTLTKPLIVKRQADTSASLPNNTAVRGFVVVTTAGSGAVIGDLLFDNGQNDAAPMTILGGGPQEGRTIAVTDPLTGGTITFDAESLYIWDSDGSSWVKIGDIGSVTGAERVIEVPFVFGDENGNVESTADIPANAKITRTVVDITTVFDDGDTTIELGRASSAALLQTSDANRPTLVSQFNCKEVIAWGGTAGKARVTLGGGTTNSTGAGTAYFFYTTPNS